jgi:hypothetical protein
LALVIPSFHAARLDGQALSGACHSRADALRWLAPVLPESQCRGVGALYPSSLSAP